MNERNELNSDKTVNHLLMLERAFQQTVAPSAIFDLKDLKCVFANQAFVKMFQLLHNPFGHRALDFLPSTLAEVFRRSIQEVLSSQKAAQADEVLLKNIRDQSDQYIDLKFDGIQNEAGVIEGVIVTASDVTQSVCVRKNCEESLRLVALTVDTLPSLIAYMDKDLTYRFINATYSKWFGLPHLDCLGKTVTDVIGKDAFEKVEPILQRVLEGEIASFDQSFDYPEHPSMSMRLQTTYIPDFDESGAVRGIVAQIQDVTKRRIDENKLRDAHILAESANQAKTAFLANMSHEIRTPLGAIMGFATLLKDVVPVNEETTEYFEIIERNSQQVLSIVDDILDLTKVEAGKMTIEKAEFCLRDTLTDFASLMAFKAKENGIDFSMIARTALPVQAVSDSTRLRQILTNVVGNAIKFTKKGGVTLYVSHRAPYLEFKVIDSGIGISAEEKSRLFEAFHQADVSTTRKFGGTGLGLVLTKKIAQAMGGDFWLESSAVNKGSVFIARVEISPAPSSKLIDRSRFDRSSQRKLGFSLAETALEGRRVLLVEDSPDNQMLINAMLKKSGAEVVIASDGKEGFDKATASEYDLVLMDVQMPRMDGYETVGKLRSSGFAKPIIAITAHAMKDEREKCILAGYSDYVAKPINNKLLIDTIRNCLDS
jgi:PAS domain S-box-containing protein